MVFSSGRWSVVEHYIGVSMRMQGKQLAAVFEDGRKYWGLSGLSYGGVCRFAGLQ